MPYLFDAAALHYNAARSSGRLGRLGRLELKKSPQIIDAEFTVVGEEPPHLFAGEVDDDGTWPRRDWKPTGHFWWIVLLIILGMAKLSESVSLLDQFKN